MLLIVAWKFQVFFWNSQLDWDFLFAFLGRGGGGLFPSFIPGVIVGGGKVVDVKERENHVSYIFLAYF